MLTQTPKNLYQEIKKLAEVRYQYAHLPKKMHHIKVFESASSKIAVLRDICLCVGIQLNLNLNDLPIVLETDPKKLREILSYRI